MELKDEKLDFEASIDKRLDNQSNLAQEVAAMKEKLTGKDQAITALSKSLMDKAKEHETGQQRICHGPLVSSLRAKFNDPSGQIIGKKNDGIREEDAAAFCRL